MKKIIYLILLLLISLPAFAGNVVTILPAAGGAPASVYNCTGGLSFGWPCEDTTVTTDEGGGQPVGCSIIGDSTATTLQTAEISGTDYSDGDEGCYFVDAQDYFRFDPTQNISASEGTIIIDVDGGNLIKLANTTEADDYIYITMGGASGAIDFNATYRTENGGAPTSYVVTADSNYDEGGTYKWVRIKYQWKVGQTDASHKIEVWALDNETERGLGSLLGTGGPEDTIIVWDTSVDRLQVGNVDTKAISGRCDRVLIYTTSGL